MRLTRGGIIMKRRVLRIITVSISLLLCVTLLSSCGILNILIPQFFADGLSGTTDFNRIEYKRPDFEAIDLAFDTFLAKLKQDANILSLTLALSDAYKLVNEAQSMYAVAEIKYYNNVNDTVSKEESEYCSEAIARLRTKLTAVYTAIIEAGLSAELLPTWTAEDFELHEIESKLYDDEYVELEANATKYENEYLAIPTALEFTHEGEQYTIDELAEMYQKGNLAPETYQKFVYHYYKIIAERSTPIYMKLIKNNNRIAEKAGYATYAEYAYKHIYRRDYSIEDAAALSTLVKEKINTLYESAASGIDPKVIEDLYYNRTDLTITSYEDRFNRYFQEVSPTMKEAFDFMKKNNLSSIGNEKGKQQVGFTTYLPSYEIPYIFIYTQNSVTDISTFVHEFGHFYSYYLNAFESDGIIDVSEIQSQTNELLFLKYYDNLTSDELYNLTMDKLSTMFTTILEGSLYDEFQRYIYENIDNYVDPVSNHIDPDAITAVFKRIADKYNYEEQYGAIYEYLWAAITHNFIAPFYYISYAVSALSALEIYSISLTDRTKALNIYRNVLNEEGYRSYSTVLTENGLHSPFDTALYDTLDDLIVSVQAQYKKNIAVSLPYSYLGFAA